MEGEIKTIGELIDEMARSRPEAAFLISPETERELTFGGLQRQSRLLATQLRQEGFERGDKIAFLLDNGLFTAQLFLGTMYGGFVSVPLNVRAGVSTLSYTLEHCDAKAVFVGDQYASLIKEVMVHVRRAVKVIPASVDGFATAGETPETSTLSTPPAPEDAALLMYTSGSTGQPKGAMHSHRTVLAHGRNSISSHQLSAADRSLLVLPLYHINAECVTLIPALLSGGSVVVPHGFNLSQFWDWLDEYRCTWSALVPTIISQLLDWKDPRADRRQAAFQRIRFLRSSSAPLSPSLHREFLDKFKLLLIQAMGSTEAGNIFSNPLAPGENKIGSPGLPWGFETRIVNQEGGDAPLNEPGEVFIRGPALMQGYYKDPTGTAAVLDSDGWFRTGDLAYRDKDGYFFVVGRSKELIIKGGVNIAPKQIDEVLESHPAVLEAAAVGVPDRYVGEDVIAFVVMRTGNKVDEKELLAFCENRLGHFKAPTRIHFVKDLPKGPSGKVQRLKLQEIAVQPSVAGAGISNGESEKGGNGHASVTGLTAASTPLEQIIAENWAQLLAQPQVDVHSNFFSLGGHSLLAIQSLSLLREKLPVVLSLSDFFENATVAQQAALIRKRLRPDDGSTGESPVAWEQELLLKIGSPGADETIPLRNRALPCPLSPNQQRIWFMERLNSGVPVYNEAEAVRLRGELNLELLEKALNVIIARHEILRTTIQANGEQPVAVVHENWPLRLKQIDLASLTPARREAEVERLLIEEPRLPYRLEVEPGIRATLLRLGPQEHVLILMMHHIICDWSSEGILWRELSALYRAGRRSQPLELPALPIQHGDYAVWQQQQMARSDVAKDLAYWEENLRGAPALLELPADRPRPGVYSYKGARRRFQIPSELAANLRDCSRREKVSLFTLFTAALHTLLYRYTGQEDILVGIPLADRDRPELQSMIGFLLHTHVLRTQLSADLSFRELLAQVQKAVLDLYTHRSPPFDQVVNRVKAKRDLSCSPLFQVMINWRDRDQQLSFIGMEGLAVESLLAETNTSKFDLTLMLTDDDGGIWLEVEYSADLFEVTRIERMVAHYRTMLEAVAIEPDRRLSELPLLTEPERQQLLVEWNRTDAPYPRDRCLHQLIEDQVERTPEAVAVIFKDKQLSYRELNERANQLARYLQSLGVGPDTLVGICMERSLEMVIGLLGILKAGGAYVPLDPEYPQERLQFMLADANVPCLLIQSGLQSRLPAQTVKVVRLDADWPRIAEESVSPVNSPVTSKHLAYMIYTSGSTGRPKGAMNTHVAIVNRLLWMQEAYRLAPSDRVLQKTPFSFDVSVWEFFWPLLTGAKLVLALPGRHKDGEYLAELICRQKITTTHFVPSMLSAFLEQKGVESSCGSLKRVICSGEALPFELQQRFFCLLPSELHNLYGPTEAAVDVTYWACDRGSALRTVPIGRPIANTRIYILDRGLQPVPIGVAGELHIGGIALARGYHNRQELTAEKFIPDPFSAEPGARLYKTGDLARYLADGAIEYLGRLDHQVKIRGFRIELGEIESVLAGFPGVREALVVARDESPAGKHLVAYVTAKEGEPPKVSELRDRLAAELPEYMVPSAFVTLDRFPLTPNGKVDRQALPRPERPTEPCGFVAPGTATEIALAKIWGEVLGLKQVGLHDSFFELGGHSLRAARLIREINENLKVNLPLRALFQHPTIGEFAKILPVQHLNFNQPQLIHLQPGESDHDLVFLIDDGSLDLFKLAGSLGEAQSSYASVLPFTESTLKASINGPSSAMPSVEELAASHAALIGTRVTRRPLVLAGHCFGGLLAFETARQIQRAGKQVEAVLLFDTWMQRPTAWWKRKTWMRAHARMLLKEGPRYLWRKGNRRFHIEKDELALRRKLAKNGEFNLYVPRRLIFRIYRNAAVKYRPSLLECRGVLFVSQDDWEANAFRQTNNSLGASPYFAGGLEVVNVPGNHVTLLDETNLSSLSRSCNETLARLQTLPIQPVRQ